MITLNLKKKEVDFLLYTLNAQIAKCYMEIEKYKGNKAMIIFNESKISKTRNLFNIVSEVKRLSK